MQDYKAVLCQRNRAMPLYNLISIEIYSESATSRSVATPGKLLGKYEKDCTFRIIANVGYGVYDVWP